MRALRTAEPFSTETRGATRCTTSLTLGHARHRRPPGTRAMSSTPPRRRDKRIQLAFDVLVLVVSGRRGGRHGAGDGAGAGSLLTVLTPSRAGWTTIDDGVAHPMAGSVIRFGSDDDLLTIDKGGSR
jgi:hypothetical protein